MSTEKVIVICAIMMFLEYLYIKENIGKLVAGSAQDALGVTGAAAVIDVGTALAGVFG